MSADSGESQEAFIYVYLLTSHDGAHHYTGLTRHLAERLVKHNRREVPHTAKHAPWSIKTAVAFRDSEKAASFERYLKTASGRSFAKKRL